MKKAKSTTLLPYTTKEKDLFNGRFLYEHCLLIPFDWLCLCLNRLSVTVPKDVKQVVWKALTTTTINTSDLIFNEAEKDADYGAVCYWNHFPESPSRGMVGIFCMDRIPDWDMFVVDSFDERNDIMYVTYVTLYIEKDKAYFINLDEKEICSRVAVKCTCESYFGGDGFCTCESNTTKNQVWKDYANSATKLASVTRRVYPVYCCRSRSWSYYYLGLVPKDLVNDHVPFYIGLFFITNHDFLYPNSPAQK